MVTLAEQAQQHREWAEGRWPSTPKKAVLDAILSISYELAAQRELSFPTPSITHPCSEPLQEESLF
jgi:hypothetical protein